MVLIFMSPTGINAVCKSFNVTSESECQIVLHQRSNFQGKFREYNATKGDINFPVKSLVIRGRCKWRLKGCGRVMDMDGNQACEESSDWGFLAHCLRRIVKNPEKNPATTPTEAPTTTTRDPVTSKPSSLSSNSYTNITTVVVLVVVVVVVVVVAIVVVFLIVAGKRFELNARYRHDPLPNVKLT